MKYTEVAQEALAIKECITQIDYALRMIESGHEMDLRISSSGVLQIPLCGKEAKQAMQRTRVRMVKKLEKYKAALAKADEALQGAL